MLKNAAPKQDTKGFKLVPESWIRWLKKVPFGGALGVALAGALLWFAPHLVPEGWKVEAVVGVFLAAGVVAHRLGESLFSWFAEPAVRHLRARWEASLQLRKVERYRRERLLPAAEARRLASQIAHRDVTGGRR
jgi:uncharacterized membrane protein